MKDLANKSDRDLLVEIHTNVDLLIEKDADKEKRLRSLERNRWVTYGGLTVLVFIVKDKISKLFGA